METTTSTTTDYHIYDPKDDPFLTETFMSYCNDCCLRSVPGPMYCTATTVDRVRCMEAFREGNKYHPIPPQPPLPDYSGQLSTVCDLLSSIDIKMDDEEIDYSSQLSAICSLLSSIESKTDDKEIDFVESMLSGETFKKIDKLGKLISPGFDTGNITASEWLKVMLIARKLRLQV